jgi:hypothetical protein
MAPHEPNLNPDKRVAGPSLLLILAAVIVVLLGLFLVLKPKPPGAVDQQNSPATLAK